MKSSVSRTLFALGIATGALALCLGLLGCGGGSTTVTKTVTVSEEEEGESAEEREPSEAMAPPEGGLGDTLTLPDEYEENGNSKVDELAWTLIGLTEGATPTGNPYSIKEAEKGGNALVRAQFTVKQEASTESGEISPTQISAIDSEGQAYPALQTEIFSPGLIPSNAGGIALAPGEQRKGYVAFAVPSSATIAKVEVKDSGYTAPDLAIWKIH